MIKEIFERVEVLNEDLRVYCRSEKERKRLIYLQASEHTHPHNPDQEEGVEPQHEEDRHDVDVLHVVGHHEGTVVHEQLLNKFELNLLFDI